MELEAIFNYIVSPELQKELFFVKIVFLSFTGIFAAAFLVFISKTEWLREITLRDIAEFFSQKARLPGRLTARLEQIKKRLEVGTEGELKLAVIEADALMEEILDNLGYKGENLEVRLKQVPRTIISEPEKLVFAHQARNNIVHDPDYKLTAEKAREIIGFYEKGLRAIEAI